MPKVSVIMPVYNGTGTLREAIESILAQTFTDFEFLILDDGSAEPVRAIVESYKDPRIKFFSRCNKGLGLSLNELIVKARGMYLARMDGDDVAAPCRLELQASFLDAHDSCAMVGGQIKLISGRKLLDHFYMPEAHRAIVNGLLEKRFLICHPAIMMRAANARHIGGYRIQGAGEDLDFFLRLSETGELANLPETVLHYRLGMNSLSSLRKEELNVAYEFAVFNARRRGVGAGELSLLEFKNSIWARRSFLQRLSTAAYNRADIYYRRHLLARGEDASIRALFLLAAAAMLKLRVSLQRAANYVLRS